MQFSAAITLLIAAVGINAAPSQTMSKRLDTIPFSIYSGAGCNDPANPNPITTAFVPTDGSCFPISPIVSGNTDSGLINTADLASLPAGCSLVAYSDSTCSSQNFIEYTQTGRCGTFGPGKLIRSARAVGTCA